MLSCGVLGGKLQLLLWV